MSNLYSSYDDFSNIDDSDFQKQLVHEIRNIVFEHLYGEDDQEFCFDQYNDDFSTYFSDDSDNTENSYHNNSYLKEQLNNIRQILQNQYEKGKSISIPAESSNSVDMFRTNDKNNKCVEIFDIDDTPDNLISPMKPTTLELERKDKIECPQKLKNKKEAETSNLIDLDFSDNSTKPEAKSFNKFALKVHPDLEDLDLYNRNNVKVKNLFDFSVEVTNQKQSAKNNSKDEPPYFDTKQVFHNIRKDKTESQSNEFRDCNFNLDGDNGEFKKFEKHETCEFLYISSINKTPQFYKEYVYYEYEYETSSSYEVFTEGDVYQVSNVIESQAIKFTQIEKQTLHRAEIKDTVYCAFDITETITDFNICPVFEIRLNERLTPLFKTKQFLSIQRFLKKKGFRITNKNNKQSQRNISIKSDLSLETQYKIQNNFTLSVDILFHVLFILNAISLRVINVNKSWVKEIQPTKHPPITF